MRVTSALLWGKKNSVVTFALKDSMLHTHKRLSTPLKMEFCEPGFNTPLDMLQISIILESRSLICNNWAKVTVDLKL